MLETAVDSHCRLIAELQTFFHMLSTEYWSDQVAVEGLFEQHWLPYVVEEFPLFRCLREEREPRPCRYRGSGRWLPPQLLCCLMAPTIHVKALLGLSRRIASCKRASVTSAPEQGATSTGCCSCPVCGLAQTCSHAAGVGLAMPGEPERCCHGPHSWWRMCCGPQS